MAMEGAGTSTAGASSGDGAQEAVQRAPAAQSSGADKGDKKDRVARARAEAERKHKPTRAPKAFDPVREAKKAMAERKAGLALVRDEDDAPARPKRGERVRARERIEESEPVEDAEHAVISPDSRDDAEDTGSETDPEGDEGDEQEPEKPPTWAKKLKVENEGLKQEKARWGDAVERIEQNVRAKDQALQQRAYEIEDLKATIALNEKVRTQLIGFLDKVAPGKFVRESLDLMLQRHENAQLQRRMQRGQEVEQRTQVHGQVRQQMDGLRKQYPELDWERSEAAKQFLARYAKRGIPVNEITQEEIRDFVAAQRFLATQRRNGAQPGTEQRRPTDVPERPGESLRTGQAGTRRRAAEPVSINSNLSNGAARKLVRQFRAAKEARG